MGKGLNEPLDADNLADHLAARLRSRYQDIPDSDIEQAVRNALARFASARIQIYTPLLAERVALGELEDIHH